MLVGEVVSFTLSSAAIHRARFGTRYTRRFIHSVFSWVAVLVKNYSCISYDRAHQVEWSGVSECVSGAIHLLIYSLTHFD